MHSLTLGSKNCKVSKFCLALQSSGLGVVVAGAPVPLWLCLWNIDKLIRVVKCCCRWQVCNKNARSGESRTSEGRQQRRSA